MSSSTLKDSELKPKHTKGSGKASPLAKKDANSQDICVICLDPLKQKISCGTCIINIFRGNKYKIVTLPCDGMHKFHHKCIYDWFEACPSHPTCPLCNARFLLK